MLDTVLISGDDVVVVWCLALWLRCLCLVLCGHQCTGTREWSVRSHLRCGMFVMYCVQCCMSVSTVLSCIDVLSRRGIL